MTGQMQDLDKCGRVALLQSGYDRGQITVILLTQ